MNKFFTYIMRCSNGRYYVGHSNNLLARFERHKNGKGARYTTQNKPEKFLWSQPFNTEIAAVKREKQIKGWSRAKKERLINGIWV